MPTLIFTYGYPPADGGVETYSAGLAEGLWRQGKAVVVLAPACPGHKTSDRGAPFPIYRVPSTLFVRELAMVLILSWLIVKHRIARILCAVWLPCGVIAWLVARWFGVPYFISAHGSELLDTQNRENRLKHNVRRRLRFLKVATLRAAGGVFAVSEYTRNLVIAEGARLGSVFTVLNGVDTRRFHPGGDGDRVRSRHGLGEGRIILTVARLDDYKGQDIVIRALPTVLAFVPDAMYLVVGRGAERPRLERLAVAMNVDGHVVFAGYVAEEELVDYYAACDVMVLVSREDSKDVEGFGLVYLEANACGKPVIGADTGGVSDAIVDGETGLLVAPNDVDQVAGAIVKLLTDRQEARRLGENGRLRAINELDWTQVSQRIWDIVDEVNWRKCARQLSSGS